MSIPEYTDADHILSEDCPCGPRVEHGEDGAILVIHNSFDGCEAMEEANKILGNNPGAN